MATIDWPYNDLNRMLLGSFREGRIAPYVEDEAQVGAGRRRAVYTRALKTFSFQLSLSGNEINDYWTFIDETTYFAVREFNFRHPYTNVLHVVRFVTIPQVQYVEGDIRRISVELREI